VELPAVSPWKRILVSVAGAAANMILAIVLAWIIYWSPESKKETSESGPEARVGHVATNAPAYAAGMRTGDLIVEVNGKKVRSWYDFGVECSLLSDATGTVAVVVQSGDQTRTLMVPYVEGEMGLRGVDGLDKQSICVISDVVAGGSAAEAGVLAGDEVYQIDGITVHGAQHFIDLVSERGGKTVPLVVAREGKRVTVMVTPKYSDTVKRALIGVQIGSLGGMAFPWMEYRNPWDQIKADAGMIGRVLKALVTPKEAAQAANGLGGPFMIVATLWVSIKVSFINALGFLRFLNVNLAILNLLPIPVVDGGHVVFALWEGITRRRVNPRFVNILVNGFAILLIGVFILLTMRDVKRLNQIFGFFRKDDAAAASNAVPVSATASNVEAGVAADTNAATGAVAETNVAVASGSAAAVP
jgi:regulator of sigma E protease